MFDLKILSKSSIKFIGCVRIYFSSLVQTKTNTNFNSFFLSAKLGTESVDFIGEIYGYTSAPVGNQI